MHRSTFLAGILVAAITGGAMADTSWEPVQSTRWVPVPPAGAASSYELVTPEGQAVRGAWRMLDSGDTLRFEVRGTGTLRVETIAILASTEDSAEYRIGVRTDPSTVRALVRKSGEARTVIARSSSGNEASVLIPEVDRWETSMVAGSEQIDVFLREDRAEPVLVRLLARGEIERPRSTTTLDDATTVRWDMRAGTLGAGFTTNAYLAPTDSNSAETAFFWPADLRLGARIEPRKNLDLDFEYGFEGVFFKDTILNVYRHHLEAQQRWSKVSVGRLGEAEFELEQSLRTKDRTYFGRGYNEEIETAAGNPPADLSYLADRFDWREFALGADVEIEATDEIDYGMSIGYVRKDYVEDYESDPDTYSLDWSGVIGSVRGEWRHDQGYYVGLGVAVRDRRYDEKFSRDATGVVVPETASHLSYWPVELEVGQYPRLGLRWEASVERERIVDHFDGYWDRTDWRLVIGSTLAVKSGHRVRVRLGRSVTNYDRSRVGNTPTGPIREKNGWILDGEGVYLLGEHWRIIASLEFLDRNNNSRTFDYSLWAGQAGMSWEF